MEPAGRYPFSVDFMKRSNRNKNLVWPMAFGAQHYHGQESALYFLLLLTGESPEFFTVPASAAIWGRVAIDYINNVKEGVRFLTQMGSKSDGLKDSKRLARHSQEWQPPVLSVWNRVRTIGADSYCENRFGTWSGGIPRRLPESSSLFRSSQ